MRPMLEAIIALSFVACSSRAEVDATTTGDRDASSGDAGGIAEDGGEEGRPSVEIGTGVDDFQPLADHQLVPFIQGPQGGGRYEGYHLWGAVRAQGLSPQGARVAFRYLRASDRSDQVAFQERIVTLQPSGTAHIAYGFAPRIHDCCLVLGTEVVMRVEVAAQDGMSGADERTIVTPDRCIDDATRQSVCP